MRLRQEYALFALVKPADDRAATAYVIEFVNCNRYTAACLRFIKDRKLLGQLEGSVKTFFVFLTIGKGKGELVINALRDSPECATMEYDVHFSVITRLINETMDVRHEDSNLWQGVPEREPLLRALQDAHSTPL
jgi:hypothetical protein